MYEALAFDKPLSPLIALIDFSGICDAKALAL